MIAPGIETKGLLGELRLSAEQLQQQQQDLLAILEKEHHLLLSANALGQQALIEKKQLTLQELESRLHQWVALTKKLDLIDNEDIATLKLQLKNQIKDQQLLLEKQNKKNLQLTLRLHREITSLMRTLSGEQENREAMTYNRKKKLNHQAHDLI